MMVAWVITFGQSVHKQHTDGKKVAFCHCLHTNVVPLQTTTTAESHHLFIKKKWGATAWREHALQTFKQMIKHFFKELYVFQSYSRRFLCVTSNVWPKCGRILPAIMQYNTVRRFSDGVRDVCVERGFERDLDSSLSCLHHTVLVPKIWSNTVWISLWSVSTHSSHAALFSWGSLQGVILSPVLQGLHWFNEMQDVSFMGGLVPCDNIWCRAGNRELRLMKSHCWVSGMKWWLLCYYPTCLWCWILIVGIVKAVRAKHIWVDSDAVADKTRFRTRSSYSRRVVFIDDGILCLSEFNDRIFW